MPPACSGSISSAGVLAISLAFEAGNPILAGVGTSDIWISLLLPIYYESFFESFHYQYSIDACMSQQASTADPNGCLQAPASTMTYSRGLSHEIR